MGGAGAAPVQGSCADARVMELLSILLEHGAALAISKQASVGGHTLLHMASLSGASRAAAMLLRAGAAADSKDAADVRTSYH